VLVDIDDDELCNACEREPITLNGLQRLWIRLAVDLAQPLVSSSINTASASLSWSRLMEVSVVVRGE
jgi:hypothetical protein